MPNPTLLRRIGPTLTRLLLSERAGRLHHGWHEGIRRLLGRPHILHLFHQTDDPYSHLLAQLLPALCETYAVELRVHLVPPPPDEAAPDRQRLISFAHKDAADIAPALGLEFSPSWNQPPADRVNQANGLLAAAIGEGRFVQAAAVIGKQLWSEAPLGQGIDPSPALAAGNALRERWGHYLGGMLFYGGEWYWGVDRLPLLEDRLAHLRTGPAALPSPNPEQTPLQGPRLKLELFWSARSPYSYIALPGVLDLVARYPIDLDVRPVLPMVSRGLAVPRAKRLYIVLDVNRQARRLGVPFGVICDPLGRPLERMFSLFSWAREQNRHTDLLWQFGQAVWARGVDASSDAGLRQIVQAAGLSWTDAQPHLDRPSWQTELEENRAALLEMGLWGVPSYRLTGQGPVFTTWGQDRLGLLEQEIRQRLSATD